MPDIKSVIKRYEKLKDRRMQWEPFFREVRDYIRPRKGKVDSSAFTPGETYTNKRYDSTATEANRILALSMQNSLTPSTVIWFNLKIPDAHPMAPLNDDPEVRGWFRDVATKMFYGMHQSNFYSVIGEAFMDYCSFGTICIEVLEDDTQGPDYQGIVYKSLPIGEYVFAEDHRGVPDSVFRLYKLTCRQAAMEFGLKNLPENMQEKMEDKPDEEYEFLRAVMPVAEYYKNEAAPKIPEYQYSVVDIAMTGGKEKVSESGYYEFPYSIGRFSKESGELWGRSPADVAMADIKVLNKLRELELRGLNKAVDPPLIAPHQGIVGAFKLIPGAINYSREPERIKFLPFEGRFDLSNLKANELRQAIRNIFMADQLIMPEKPNMTASEVLTLKEQVQRMLGPTVSRFESEVLNPLVRRTFSISYRTGQFPDPPEQLDGLDDLDIEFVGTLAKAQKLQDVTSVMQWFETFSQAMQVSPEVADIVNMEEIVRMVGERLSVPADVMRPVEEVQQLRQQRQAQMAEQKQMEQLMQTAQAAGQGGPGVKALMESGIADAAN